ncbi:isochorismate synthase [Macrococcus armenti]|uniref:isochorismate synthase n=1 Tax=Macrococcus armenti TaxID=2875764 RepID=UPI001CD32CDB|nr:isochorismate synthase [Macrococcus armenti]UBH10358.1 isochorismate synthase [Macrococcus armenti]
MFFVPEDLVRAIYQYPYEGCTNEVDIFNYFADYKGERYLYINKDKSLKIIGIGIQSLIKRDTIDPDGVEKVYQSFVHNSEVFGDDKLQLKLFGGFYFDEDDSEDFSTFHKSHFIIPKIQIIIEESASWIIFTNAPIDKERVIDALMHLTGESVASRAHALKCEDIDLDLFRHNAAHAIAQMKSGAFNKVVLSRKRRIEMDAEIQVEALIDKARLNHEASYLVVMESGSKTFISKTPEQLVMVNGAYLYTNAIAGTMSKSVDDAKAKLLADEKNLIEHKIVVDSIKDDLIPYVCDITMKDHPQILENQFLYHLYTPIKAKLKTGSTLRVTHAMHPTPALGGYPKVQATEYIMQAGECRGLYGAPIGYVDADGNGEFIVAIRSMVIERNEAVLFAGCGIVEDSEVESEVYETEVKFKPMLQMLGVTHNE